jgi:hypothetical protein
MASNSIAFHAAASVLNRPSKWKVGRCKAIRDDVPGAVIQPSDEICEISKFISHRCQVVSDAGIDRIEYCPAEFRTEQFGGMWPESVSEGIERVLFRNQ